MNGTRRAGLVVGLMLAAGVILTGGLAAQEVATVELRGQPVFPVVAFRETTAAARALEVQQALTARLQGNEPLAPVRIVASDSAAALVINQDTLVVVTPRDAEVVLNRAVPAGAAAAAATQEVARQWAERLSEVFAREAAEERARVVVQGTPLFEVGGTPELRAARRAEAAGVRIAELTATEGPTPEITIRRRGRGAEVLAGGTALLEVGPAEAAAFGTSPEELAAERALSIRRAVESIRQQRSWPYRLRLLGYAAAVSALVLLAHLGLRRVSRRLRDRTREEPGEGLGLKPVVLQWAISVVQFFAWVGLGVFLLWLVPATRPLTFDAAADALRLLRGGLGWLRDDGWVLLLILVITGFVARFAGAVVRQVLHVFGMRHGGRVELRAETLEGTASGGVQILVFFFGMLAVLAQLEVDLLPVLASAGVAGIAIGFGVQSLIRDFFTGLFILIEDQYGVGDLIQVKEISGKVERFTLRITQIRSLDGSLTSIPNGEITTVTNLSKDWSQVVLDVNIAIGEDVDRAIDAITETATQLARDWGDRIQGEPEVLGVETVDPLSQAITIRVVLRTAPLERWSASRELRRRILDAFRAREIQVPPRAVVTVAGGGMPQP